jgi:hypothetical protein
VAGGREGKRGWTGWFEENVAEGANALAGTGIGAAEVVAENAEHFWKEGKEEEEEDEEEEEGKNGGEEEEEEGKGSGRNARGRR